MRLGLLALAIVTLSACGAAEPRPAPPSPSPPAAAPAPSAVPSKPEPAVEPGPQPLTLEAVAPRPTPEPLPHVEIAFPFAEQTIRLAKAPRYVVRLKVENWISGKPGEKGVELSLDGFRPRRLHTLESPVRLGDLVPADQVLQAGEHVLTALAVHADGQAVRAEHQASRAPFAIVHFWVGQKGKPTIDTSEPMLRYSQPRGTYNGPASADAVFFDCLPLNARLGIGDHALRVSVTGEGYAGELMLRKWQPVAIRGLPSGDFLVLAELVGPDGSPVQRAWARAERTITVNRDAPVPEG